MRGKVVKVIKFASDVSAQKAREAEYESLIRAADTSQALIYFTPDGHVLDANANFLNALGYTLDEIRGRHHRSSCQRRSATHPLSQVSGPS